MEWFLYGRLSTADLRLLAVLASPQRPTFCERRDVAGPRRAQAAEKGMGALEHPWAPRMANAPFAAHRSEEHTSELQSLAYLVCRLLLEKKKQKDAHSAGQQLRHAREHATQHKR